MMFRKGTIFLSHSSETKFYAYNIRELLIHEKKRVISDIDRSDSFWGFMDKIEECKYVWFILNNSFFSSPYCVYEVYKAITCKKKIFTMKLCKIDVENGQGRKNSYDKMIQRLNDTVMTGKQMEFFQPIYTNFESYEELILKLLNEIEVRCNFNNYIEGAIELFNKTWNTKLKPNLESKELFMNNKEIYGLEVISNVWDYADFAFFLHDLTRCSYFAMSLFEEDSEGEEKWKYVDHELKKTPLGYAFDVSVINAKGAEQLIRIDNIKTIEQNMACHGEDFMKYYFLIYKKEEYKKYRNEMKKDDNYRDKGILDAFEDDGIEKRRIILFFEDHNAYE